MVEITRIPQDYSHISENASNTYEPVSLFAIGSCMKITESFTESGREREREREKRELER